MYRFTTKGSPKAELLGCVYCPEYSNCYNMSCNEVYNALSKLRYYEDLDEQGMLFVPPCKVNDVVYCIWQYTDCFGEVDEPFIKESTAKSFVFDNGMKIIPSDYAEMSDSWNKLVDVCLTYEEAKSKIDKFLSEYQELVKQINKNIKEKNIKLFER